MILNKTWIKDTNNNLTIWMVNAVWHFLKLILLHPQSPQKFSSISLEKVFNGSVGNE